MASIYKPTLLFITVLSIFLPLMSNAAGLVPCGGEGEADCTTCDFFVMTKGAIDFIIIDLVTPLAALFVVTAGIILFTSGGSDNQISLAKRMLYGVIIGALIIYGAWLIVDSILLMLTGSGADQPAGFPWPWHTIKC